MVNDEEIGFNGGTGGVTVQFVEWMSAAEWLRRHPGLFAPDTFYARLNDGTLPCIRAGKKLLVPNDVLERRLVSERANKAKKGAASKT
jgi:hypothetical protein